MELLPLLSDDVLDGDSVICITEEAGKDNIVLFVISIVLTDNCNLCAERTTNLRRTLLQFPPDIFSNLA